MAKIISLKNEDQMSAIKKAVGNGKEAMRKVYSTHAEAQAAFAKAAELAKAANVMTYEAPADRFVDGMQPVVAVVGSRERNAKGTFESGIRGVVLFAIPSVQAFLSHDEKSQDWIAKIAEKEASHVAFRALRNADTTDELQAAFEGMPADVDTFVADYRGDGLDTEAFDTIWTDFRKLLNESMPALVKLLPGKGEVLKAIRSKAYAESEAELKELEAKGVFVFLGRAMIKAGAEWKNNETGDSDPVDTTAISEWLADRDTFTYREKQAVEKDFSVLEGLNLGILDEPEAPAEAPTEAAKGGKGKAA